MAENALTPASIALIVVGCWIGMCLFVSAIGWSRLSEIYPQDGPFEGRVLRFQSGGFRNGAGYDRTLSVGVSSEGLLLRVTPFLRLGHPPLFIPWTEIRAAEVEALMVKRVELRFASAPQVGFRIKPVLAQRFAELVPEQWSRVEGGA